MVGGVKLFAVATFKVFVVPKLFPTLVQFMTIAPAAAIVLFVPAKGKTFVQLAKVALLSETAKLLLLP